MSRRHFFRQIGALAAVPLAGSLLTACGPDDPNTGPVEVKWDRDPCERCNMVLSDRHYAAQIRDPQKVPHKFDDFGCAIIVMRDKGWPEDQIEFWVTDFKTGQWINAFKARYFGGKMTPMGYGLGATTIPNPGDMSYEEAKQNVLARGK